MSGVLLQPHLLLWGGVFADRVGGHAGQVGGEVRRHAVRRCCGVIQSNVVLEGGELCFQLALVDVLWQRIVPTEDVVDLLLVEHEVSHVLLHPLDLVDVHLLELLLQVHVGRLHRVHCHGCGLQLLRRKRRLIHVELSALELIPLLLVHLLPLQDGQRLLFDARLCRPSHTRQLLLVASQLVVTLLDLRLDVSHAAIDMA
mmetsp:Transcript_22063/g.54187  ORF Transcript_22063/g.54187 Transcript_22063/m.54187 type:complete len:200 (+) Transcript_22063:323-922(+)